MSLTTSYVVSLQTSKTVGLTSGDKSVDSTSSLKQAINNILLSGTSFTLDIELSPGETRIIDFLNLGVSYLRMILLKCDFQFGYSLSEANPSTEAWHLGRTLFVDFDLAPPISFADTGYIQPTIISISNPTSIHPVGTDPIVVQLIGISN